MFVYRLLMFTQIEKKNEYNNEKKRNEAKQKPDFYYKSIQTAHCLLSLQQQYSLNGPKILSGRQFG